MTDVEIRVGDSWLEDARFAPDIDHLLDYIDLVIDGDNVTANVQREPVIRLILRLRRRLRHLASGLSSKVSLSFVESTWELVLSPLDDTRLALSLYDLAPNGAIACHNRPISAARLHHAVEHVTETLLAQLLQLEGGELMWASAVAALREPLPPLPPLQARRHEPTGDVAAAGQVSAGPLSLRYTLDLTHPDLLAPHDPTCPLDYHALLAPGSIHLHPEGEPPAALCQGYPFHTIRALLTHLRSALQALEQAHPPARFNTQPLARALTAHPWEIQVHSQLTDPPARRRVVAALSDLVSAVVALTRALVRSARGANPTLSANERLRDLEQQVDHLDAWFRALGEGDLHGTIAGDDDGAWPEQRGDRSDEVGEGGFSFPLTDVRRMALREHWSVAADDVRFQTAIAYRGHLLIEMDRRLTLLDLKTGDARWSQEELPDAPMFLCADDLLLHSPGPGRVRRLDRMTGQLLWERPVRDGQAIVAAWTHQRAGHPWLVAQTSRGELLSMDAYDGAVAWRFRLDHGRPARVVCRAPVVTIASDDGFVYGLNPRGERVWRFRAAHGPRTSWAMERWTLLLTAPHESARLVALDTRNGQPRWRQQLPGRPLGDPIVLTEQVLVYVAQSDTAELIALDLDSGQIRWRHPFQVAGLTDPTRPLLAPNGQLVVKTDRDEVTSLDRQTGAIRWTTRLSDADDPDILLMNLPLSLHLGALVVPGSTICLLHPDTGALIHSLGGLPHHPDFLHVTPELQFIVGEQDEHDGHITSFRVEHFLAVVH